MLNAKVGRNNLVPEFNFMDPRAIGKWDMLPLETTKSAVWAMDVQEAGNYGEVSVHGHNSISRKN